MGLRSDKAEQGDLLANKIRLMMSTGPNQKQRDAGNLLRTLERGRHFLLLDMNLENE